MEQNFITARDAVHLLAPIVGCDQDAKELIFSRIQDCSLKLFGEWLAQQADVGPIPHLKPNVSHNSVGSEYALQVLEDLNNPGAPFAITGAFINFMADDSFVDSDWRWFDGTLVSREGDEVSIELSDGRSGSIASRWVLGRAQFKRAEIEQLAESFASPTFKRMTLAKAVEREDLDLREDWWNWMAELAAWIHECGASRSISANKIIDEIDKRVAEQNVAIPGRTVLYPAAKKIAERMKALYRAVD